MIRAALLSLMLLSAPVLAQSREGFVAGPVLPDVGPIAPVDSDLPLPKGTKFKIDFDIAVDRVRDANAVEQGIAVPQLTLERLPGLTL